MTAENTRSFGILALKVKYNRSVKDARGKDNAQEILRHLPWLLVKFGIILYIFIAKGTRDPRLVAVL